jgi:hypothetical protein
MSSVGTVVRDPGIVPLPTTNTILRGQMVSFTPGTAGADGNALIPAAAAAKVYGVALSDADPDLKYVPVGVKGGYTMSMTPATGQTFQQGGIVYQDSTDFSKVTAVVGTNAIVGWAVSGKPDSLGNIEVGFFLF